MSLVVKFLVFNEKGKENMIKPQPHKLKCQKCTYTKVVSPKSDTLELTDFARDCPKCNSMMERTSLGKVEKFIAKIFGR